MACACSVPTNLPPPPFPPPRAAIFIGGNKVGEAPIDWPEGPDWKKGVTSYSWRSIVKLTRWLQAHEAKGTKVSFSVSQLLVNIVGEYVARVPNWEMK